MEAAAELKVKPVKKCVDIRVVCDPPSWVTYRWQTIEQKARSLERWAAELEEFVRDHRSRDSIGLSVERDIKTVCSGCEREWDPTTEDGKTFCAYCGKEADV